MASQASVFGSRRSAGDASASHAGRRTSVDARRTVAGEEGRPRSPSRHGRRRGNALVRGVLTRRQKATSRRAAEISGSAETTRMPHSGRTGRGVAPPGPSGRRSPAARRLRALFRQVQGVCRRPCCAATRRRGVGRESRAGHPARVGTSPVASVCCSWAGSAARQRHEERIRSPAATGEAPGAVFVGQQVRGSARAQQALAGSGPASGAVVSKGRRREWQGSHSSAGRISLGAFSAGTGSGCHSCR